MTDRETLQAGSAQGVDETGWIIEKDDPPVYHLVSGDHDEHWTDDVNKALRFARKEDADAYVDHVGWTSPPVRTAEHMWIAPRVVRWDRPALPAYADPNFRYDEKTASYVRIKNDDAPPQNPSCSSGSVCGDEALIKTISQIVYQEASISHYGDESEVDNSDYVAREIVRALTAPRSESSAGWREALELAKNIIFGAQHAADRERNYAKSAEYQSCIDIIDAALSPPAATSGDFEQWAKGWHRTCETIMTMLGLSCSGSPEEMLGEVQGYLAKAPTERSVAWREADKKKFDDLLDDVLQADADYNAAGIVEGKYRRQDYLDARQKLEEWVFAAALASPASPGAWRDEVIEECARLVEPKTLRPCDCEPFGCYCHNNGDAATVASWDAETATAKAIRALKAAPDAAVTKSAPAGRDLTPDERAGVERALLASSQLVDDLRSPPDCSNKERQP